MGLCDGRVCIVTGAGRGIGREYALMLAAEGAKVVVNDLGGSRDGTGGDEGPAAQVVEEILEAGGDAAVSTENVADFEGAGRMVRQAVDTYGRLDVLINNAGILRDRMLANMSEEEWDAVINVHLKGTFAPSHHAAAHWRERSKAGDEVDGRIINTSSVSGIYGNVGQTNYGAAKAGIAAFSFIATTWEWARPTRLPRRRCRRGGSHPWLPGSPRSIRRRSPVGSSRRQATCWPSPRDGTVARRRGLSTTRSPPVRSSRHCSQTHVRPPT
jgi:NAD(P)-dependent dehydrogenase (short-subunit alcohol dehydrogenase family)